MSSEPELEVSSLSQEIFSDGKTVDVQIHRLKGDAQWVLEVVDQYGNSTVWDDAFQTDSAALAEANEVIASEGISALIGPAK